MSSLLKFPVLCIFMINASKTILMVRYIYVCSSSLESSTHSGRLAAGSTVVVGLGDDDV